MVLNGLLLVIARLMVLVKACSISHLSFCPSSQIGKQLPMSCQRSALSDLPLMGATVELELSAFNPLVDLQLPSLSSVTACFRLIFADKSRELLTTTDEI